MRKQPMLGSEKGFGLVIVLAAILAVGMLGTDMLRQASRAVRQAGFERDKLKAYMLARGGVEWVKSVPLKTATGGGVDFWEFWSRARRREFRGGIINVRIIDESARLDLSDLIRHWGPVPKNILGRLFASLGIPKSSQDTIFVFALSQKASVSKIGIGSGAAKATQQPPFVTVGEVRELVGAPSTWDQLAPHLTVVSNGKVNVNRAGRTVLAALFPVGGETAAGAISDLRSFKPFSSVAKLSEELLKSGIVIPGEIKIRMTTSSETVTVWSLGEFANQSQAVVATLNWQGGTWAIVSFRSAGFLKDLDLKNLVEGF